MLKITDTQIEKINAYFDYIDNTLSEEESNSIKSEVFLILMNERYLTKENLRTKAEMFLYTSGIYKEIRKTSLKTARNQRAYLNKKNKPSVPEIKNDSDDFDEFAYYENSFNN